MYSNFRPSERQRRPESSSRLWRALSQTLFNGFQNLNAVRKPSPPCRLAARIWRNIEQSILLDGVTAYVDVVRDTAVICLRENNDVLTEQLKQTKDRFDVGEVTRTDVAKPKRVGLTASRPCGGASEPQGKPGHL
jgi:outer membrane protein